MAVINTNIASLNAQRNLTRRRIPLNTCSVSSSGLRISAGRRRRRFGHFERMTFKSRVCPLPSETQRWHFFCPNGQKAPRGTVPTCSVFRVNWPYKPRTAMKSRTPRCAGCRSYPTKSEIQRCRTNHL